MSRKNVTQVWKTAIIDSEAAVTASPDEDKHQITLFNQNDIVSYKYQGQKDRQIFRINYTFFMEFI